MSLKLNHSSKLIIFHFSSSPSHISWRRILAERGWKMRMLRIMIRLGIPERGIIESRNFSVAAQKVRKI